MSAAERTLELSHPFTEFESQVLLITVPNDIKETVSPQNSPSHLSQTTTPFTEVKGPLHASYNSLNDVMETLETLGSAPPTAKNDSKAPQENKPVNVILPSPRKRIETFSNDPAFSPTNVMPPPLKPSSKVYLHKDDSVASQLSAGNFQFNSQMTSLHLVLTPYKFRSASSLNPNPESDQTILWSSKQLAPYEYWINKNIEIYFCAN